MNIATYETGRDWLFGVLLALNALWWAFSDGTTSLSVFVTGILVGYFMYRKKAK